LDFYEVMMLCYLHHIFVCPRKAFYSTNSKNILIKLLYLNIMSTILFLAWAPYSVRAESISTRLGASLHTLSYKTRLKVYSPIKYPLLFYRTLRLLVSERPTTIICQTPPIFCPLAALFYAATNKKKNIRIIIDAHTATFEKPWSYPILKTLTRWAIGNAIAVIVANEELQNVIYQNYGVMPLVLDDGVPQVDYASQEASQISINRGSKSDQQHLPVSMHAQLGLKGREDESARTKFAVAVISSFANDEPIEEVIEAAKILADTTIFYITGDQSRLASRKLFEWKLTANNVIFTGFLNQREYIGLLKRVDAIMVLTTRHDNMLSGAHEALALEQPLITSDWPPLRKYFCAGTAYVNNSVKGIVNAVKYVQLEKDQMKEEMRVLKQRRLDEWERKVSAFKEHFIEGRTREDIFHQAR
jgi:glycosyltransferase involved in cell wall biosynthesis